jgi:hypothetical protein
MDERTPMRKLTVTSSLTEGRWTGYGGGGGYPPTITFFLQQTSTQVLKDDVNGISSTLDICLYVLFTVKDYIRIFQSHF